MYIYIYTFIYVYISLSLSIYIYIYSNIGVPGSRASGMRLLALLNTATDRCNCYVSCRKTYSLLYQTSPRDVPVT